MARDDYRSLKVGDEITITVNFIPFKEFPSTAIVGVAKLAAVDPMTERLRAAENLLHFKDEEIANLKAALWATLRQYALKNGLRIDDRYLSDFDPQKDGITFERDERTRSFILRPTTDPDRTPRGASPLAALAPGQRIPDAVSTEEIMAHFGLSKASEKQDATTWRDRPPML